MMVLCIVPIPKFYIGGMLLQPFCWKALREIIYLSNCHMIILMDTLDRDTIHSNDFMIRSTRYPRLRMPITR